MQLDSAHYVTINALIIKKNNFGESHSFYTLFDEGLGKISVSAYGSRKEKSQSRSDLVIAHQITGQVFRKSDDRVYNIKEAKTVRTFPSILQSIKKVGYLYLLFEIIDCLPPYHQEREVFQILLLSVERMEAFEEIAKYAFFAVLKIFHLEGILPDWKEKDQMTMMLSEFCGQDFAIGNGTLRLIADIQTKPDIDFLDTKSLSQSVIKNTLQFITHVIKNHYGRDLKSTSLIRI